MNKKELDDNKLYVVRADFIRKLFYIKEKLYSGNYSYDERRDMANLLFAMINQQIEEGTEKEVFDYLKTRLSREGEK